VDRPLGGDGVIYDKALDLYIAVDQDNADNALWFRASSDLLHWSDPLPGTPYPDASCGISCW
jgi:hypothetical protein